MTMMTLHTNRQYGLFAAITLLGGCALEKLEAEFHMTEPPVATTTASGTSGTSGTSESSSPDTSSTGSSGGSMSVGGSSSGESTVADDTEGTSASSSSGEAPAICGDGIVGGEEECDDLNDDDLDACSNDCARAFTIFVTSEEMYTGKINGLVGADNRCVNAALNAPLPRGLHYTALISDSTTDAAERLHHARGWYRLVNGLPVARGWDALMTGPLVHAVNVNEKSETADTRVWTGTAPGGFAVPGADHCSNWSIESNIITGHFGASAAVDSNWLYWSMNATNPTDCYAPRALYCVEQP